MKNRTEVGTERILCSSVGRVLTLATLLALTFGIVGCQNGKCQSCLFRSRDKEKIDETQLGQVKNQEPPAPPAISPTSSVDGSAANPHVFKSCEWDGEWNLVKVIKRGLGVVGESVDVTVETKKLVIRLR